MAEGSGEWEKPREMRFERALDERERSAKCLVKVVLRRRLPPGKARESERPSDSCPSTESRTSARRRTRHDLVACDLDERDRLGVTWLEADGRARCNVEALEEGLLAVERHGAVDLAKVEMRPDLRMPKVIEQERREE